MPKHLTKHVAASAPAIASAATAKMDSSLAMDEDCCIFRKRDWYVNHSLTKPLNGGIADMARHAVKKNTAVTGIFLISPPNFSISFVPVAYCMEPAPRKRAPF